MRLRNQSGQIIVEYLLLMMIAVVAASIIVSQFVGRRDDVSSSGVLIRSWHKILNTLGNDLPDCSKQKNFNKPECPP